MKELILQPWSWWFSGIVIAVVMFILIFSGKSFGFSSNLKTLCTLCGAGRVSTYFNFDWKSQRWNLVFLVGALIGGYIAGNFLCNDEPVAISQNTIDDLAVLGFSSPTSIQPEELYGMDNALTLKGFFLLALGGLFVGFGTRYAGGCTSGHAISGLSNLQLPSLIAVIGFFIGGLVMTFLLFPIIFN